MQHTKLIPILFLALPILELYLLVRIGAVLGFFPVFIWVLIAATLGIRLLQFQSWAIWNRLQQSLRSGEHPARELLENAVVMAGGLLLIVPGFITDLIALACLIPASRRRLALYLERHGETLLVTRRRHQPDSHTIEGEFRREK